LSSLDISVVIMAFNEVNNLKVVFGEIESVLNSIGKSYEVLIINDGSSDGTEVIAGQLARDKENVRVITHEKNLGLGGVYRTGFSQARGESITFFPADGQFPATIIKRFAPLMEGSEMVLGYLPNRDGSLLAKFLSAGERVLYRLLLGPMPRFQGIVMFRRELLDELELRSVGRGWSVLMELIIRAARGGYRITSEPTEVRPRISGKSKVNNFRTIWANFKQMVALRSYL
jgi:glycosyltransferase involved in cell wall biosynthesis